MSEISKETELNIDYIRTGYSRFDKLSDAKKLDVDTDIARSMNLPISDLLDYPNWYVKCGKKFYFKKRNGLSGLLNELLGEDLSRWMDLPTVHYDIVENDDGEIIGLFSENVRKKDVIYRKSKFLSKYEVEYIRRVFTEKDFECDQKFKRDLTYYIVRNYFAALRDRYSNSEIIVNEDGFEIPHLMDYESSYIDHLLITYCDPMLDFTFNPESIDLLKENNEYFVEAVDRAFSYNYRDALMRIENEHKIVIPYSVRDYYKEFEARRRETMEYMGLKQSTKTK